VEVTSRPSGWRYYANREAGADVEDISAVEVGERETVGERDKNMSGKRGGG
jgi:hypothetical protein